MEDPCGNVYDIPREAFMQIIIYAAVYAHANHI